MRRLVVLGFTAVFCTGLAAPAQATFGTVLPTLQHNLVSYYDFEHPVRGDKALEQDSGRSGTTLQLINGGAGMRVRDGAFRHSRDSLQLQQITPAAAGNDDWKAGLYSDTGVPTLKAFNGARQASIMGWVKMTGQNPAPNSNSVDPSDLYGAIGLAGVLTGDSNGHAVRALLELIQVDGELKLVALARRIDGGDSQTFAATDPWQKLLPQNEWVFLAATFDFDTGTMALYRNGNPLAGRYVAAGDPWKLEGEPEPDLASATDPRGYKIGGSYPQNTREGNACNCRMDSLMFLDRAARPWEVRLQYRWMKN
ncbi:LamG-like jellyroll fold domain-containing protein [Lentzea flaviverrucosa]|uniref:Concanavalin A-like lectin/glucanases superfamily protein n=1 Tax=Lentzea flaviverrucosa TaxID=200379 RepID=A0A1H9JT87_9PSEU|nr:LamG-like jellyroll fold domain-containing protein [Lentzea flaviverrucosa]RDI26622.1 concanavalin A-like lectin/glucanase superfamily protein [Lentzea flaviverrucosa]SEQ90003.1 Concanavalin A-like lectin/glucanases superfamily protein [Lentzea flaviverrucosa]